MGHLVFYVFLPLFSNIKIMYNYINLLGHSMMLQLAVSEGDPEQSFPKSPGIGLLHSLVLVYVPPPQETPQSDQLDQYPQLPSTGFGRNTARFGGRTKYSGKENNLSVNILNYTTKHMRRLYF